MDYLMKYERLDRVFPMDSVSEHSESCLHEISDTVPLAFPTGDVWDLYTRERQFDIVAMEEKFLDKVVEFVVKYFIPVDVMCRAVHLIRNEEALNYYKKLVRYWCKDRTSVIAIEKGNDRIVGVLIAKVSYLLTKTQIEAHFSRVIICNSRVQTIQDLRCNVRKMVLEKISPPTLNKGRYIEIKLFCTDRREINCDDIERRLLLAIEKYASKLNINCVVGVMSCLREQRLLHSLGYNSAFRAEYALLTYNQKPLFPVVDENRQIVGFFRMLEEVQVKVKSSEEEEAEEINEVNGELSSDSLPQIPCPFSVD